MNSRRPRTLSLISLLAIWTWAGPAWAGSSEPGYRVTGNDGLTVVVNARGDLDGDAIPDVGVGVPEENGASLGSGAVYVFLGKNVGEDGLLDLADADYVIEGGSETAGAGTTVSFLFDEDGDGRDEITIGFDDGASEQTVYSAELADFSTTQTAPKAALHSSTTVGVSVGVARNMDCSLDAKATRASSSSPIAVFSSLLLAGLFLLRKATIRR